MVQRRTPQGVAAPGTAGWIGKDGSLGVNPGPEADQGMDLPPAVVTEPVAARAAIPATARNDDEDEEETRELS